MVLLSLLVVLVIGVSSDAHNQDLTFSPCQTSDDIAFVSLDNVTLEEGYLSSCLVIGCSWYGGSKEVGEQNLSPNIRVTLSMDNVSWLRSVTHSFDEWKNTSYFFRISNSIFESFPFDVEPGETLYVSILFGYSEATLNWRPEFNHQTPSVGIVVHSGIIRNWHFTIDWRGPGIFGFVSVWVGAVFLMSRLLKPQTGH